jgi:hypothetical protein
VAISACKLSNWLLNTSTQLKLPAYGVEFPNVKYTRYLGLTTIFSPLPTPPVPETSNFSSMSSKPKFNKEHFLLLIQVAMFPFPPL